MNDLISLAEELAEYLDAEHADVDDAEDIGGNVKQAPNWAMQYAARLRDAAYKARVAERLRSVAKVPNDGDVARDMASTLRAIVASADLAKRTGNDLAVGPLMRKRIDASLEKYEAAVGVAVPLNPNAWGA